MSSSRSQILLFFAAVACVSVALGVHDSIFNNFLSDTYSMSAKARGWLELPREAPGFLVVLTAGLLASLAVTRVGMIAALLYGLGMVGMAVLGGRFATMMAAMCLGSAGMHLLQPVRATIIITLSDAHNRGRQMGVLGAVNTVGLIAGTGLVWLTFDKAAPQYRTGFLVAAALAGATCLFYGLMHLPHLQERRSRMIIRKRYWLYYLLELFFGARKQIFITFGPWVLVRVYGAPVTSIAGLLMLAAVIGIVFKPLAGVLIDHFGERAILVADGIVLAFVCLGYGYAEWLTGNPHQALVLASACYVADNLLFALGSGRAIYLSRLTNSADEISATLAMGVSINHIVSMAIPPVAGAIWAGFGYQRVFLWAAVLAVTISGLSTLVPGKDARPG